MGAGGLTGMVSRAVLGAPIYTLAAYRGMGEAPDALRRAGFARAMGATEDLGNVRLPRLERDSLEGRTKNLKHFKECTARICDATAGVRSEFVVVLGGECSETVGAMAGFSKAFGGKTGMLWMDAHGDFNAPEISPSGYVGGMCLAMATGRGPDTGVTKPLSEERLVHVGSRALDAPEAAALRDSSVKLFTAGDVKKEGAAEVASMASRHLDGGSDWIACHLDLDVVDPSIIPAVNYPASGGLTLEETAALIGALRRTGKLRVLELAAYNSEKDQDGSTAKKVVEFCAKALS